MIEFSDGEKELLVQKIKRYFDQELDRDLGQFEAEEVLDFFSEEVGSYFYNRGLLDAQAVLAERLDVVQDAIYELEKPTAFIKE
ncbi:MAG: DUF2164 domain-containing protein [Ghiorsea sp.]|nr:DUF2164 domain-containing protein [Ghiorsea sp.]MDQ7058242.1 DUF2164 domain-containing protein [Ghiorsea sp.]